MTIQETLDEREGTHGSYEDQARTAQMIKAAIMIAPNWHEMEPCMRESLEFISTKMSRLLHGDFTHADSWHDIAGYAQLVEKALEAGN